jgi:hypothetical protein
MKEPREHLTGDLKALRYLDALNAGDLDAVAALWDEASRNPRLERMLTEIDGALFVEEAEGDRKAEAERTRGPIQKPLPGDSPATRPLGTRWRRVGVVGGFAAAGLLAVFAWPGRDASDPAPSPSTIEFAHEPEHRPPDHDDHIAAWQQYRRALDGDELPTFTWPLHETSPGPLANAIPPDLLD